MILPGQMIRMRGIFTPFCERSVRDGLSYGLSCAGYDIRLREGVTLVQGHTTLGVSLEHMDFPPDLLGMVADKSTWARRGVQVQHTVIEPGWRGYLAIELTYQPVVTVDQASALLEFRRLEGEIWEERSKNPFYVPEFDDERKRVVDAVKDLRSPTPEVLMIAAGSPIAQVLVHQLVVPAERPYVGKYQDQLPDDVRPKLEGWWLDADSSDPSERIFRIDRDLAAKLRRAGFSTDWDHDASSWIVAVSREDLDAYERIARGEG